jgi:hypothetical protein
LLYVDTALSLRPGPLVPAVVGDALEIASRELAWRPSTFGSLARHDTPVVGDDIRDMLDFYARKGTLFLEGEKMEWDFCGNRGNERSARGYVSWGWHVAEKAWSVATQRHRATVVQLAKALRSPYVRSCLPRDRRETRIVEVDAKTIFPNAKVATIKKEIPKVDTYREGLTALYWRNIFGPEFVEMFGERLRTLPGDVAWDLGDGYWLVQPYASPGDASTEAGRAREAEIVAHLGPDCFYDDAREQPPTRVPRFSEEIDPVPPLM